MLSIKYVGPNNPFQLVESKIPSLDPDEVLIKLEAASLCHTELHFIDGTLNLGVNNITMGHEGAGVIVAVGSNIPKTRINQRVLVYYYVGCGHCKFCDFGNEQLCPQVKVQHGFTSDGTFSGYLKTVSRNAVELPHHISFDKASTIGCGVTTAVHATKLANVKENEWIVILGVNGVGFNILQLIKNHYKAKVIAICRSENKRQKALDLGADAVIDGTDTSCISTKIREITEGEGADVIFECVGHRETMDQCVGWSGGLGRRGRLVMIGYTAGSPEHDFRVHPIPLIVYEQQIIGSVGATYQDLLESIQYVSTGIIDPVIDSTIAIHNFQQGLDRLRCHECVGKIVINKFQ